MNPFSLTFGKEPSSFISQDYMVEEIVNGLTSSNPEFQVCMITGLRGSGKTVLMTKISAEIKERYNDWIVVELNPERDMLQALAAELSNRKELLQIFKDAKINLSLFGFGFEIDSEPPITDVAVALDRMLMQLTRKGKKVLITLDEAVSNQYVRVFTSQFQIYMRKNYNVYMMMTGLYENIYELQNEKTQTVLFRAPKFDMMPLNTKLVAKEYMRVFGISEEEANRMAAIVQGYPYAYQVLGYLCYKNNTSYENVLDELDAYLGQYVYEKIMSEVSKKDSAVIIALAKSKSGSVKEIRDNCQLKTEEFSVYRHRLIKKKIVKPTKYAYLEFNLPRFKQFVLQYASTL